MQCATEAHETIQWMLLKEKRYSSVRNSLYLTTIQRHGMTATWRLSECRWMFETARKFELQMDTVFGALHFLDQYLSVHSVDRITLQLMSMVCMWTASKMQESKPILLEEMALMCENEFSRAQMVEAEEEVANLIGFRFSPPNVFTMARDFVSELPFEQDTDRRANCVASVFNVLERVVENISSLDCSVSSLAKAAVQLVAKSEYHLTVPQLLEALKIIKIEEDVYRTAFKIVRGAYFGTSHALARSQTSQATISKGLDRIKSLPPTLVPIDHVVQFYGDSDADQERNLICRKPLSPSSSQASPSPKIAIPISSTIGVTSRAPLSDRHDPDTEQRKKRQRKLTTLDDKSLPT